MAHMKFEIILMHLGLLSSSIIARTAIFASWSPVGKAHTSSVRGQKLLRGALQLAMQNLSAVPSRGTDSSNRRARSVCRSLIFVLRGEFLQVASGPGQGGWLRLPSDAIYVKNYRPLTNRRKESVTRAQI
jgi:hypothetical protein